MSDAGRMPAAAGQVERPVRPPLLTEKELLDIVDTLIRDRAYNRPAAVAIGMAVGAAVEAEVRARCAKPVRGEGLGLLPEPFGWVHDGLPGGGLAFQKYKPDGFAALVFSAMPVYSHAQLTAEVAAERDRWVTLLRHWAVDAERESGPEAAGWLERAIDALGPND